MSTNGIVRPAKPALDLLFDPGAPVAELGELDQMLELQVVDVVDHLSSLPVEGTP